MLQRNVIVRDFHGLRMRPAAKIVNVCKNMDSKVTISRGSEIANGNSILELLLLDAEHGCELHIVADGNEEEMAMRNVIGLF